MLTCTPSCTACFLRPRRLAAGAVGCVASAAVPFQMPNLILTPASTCAPSDVTLPELTCTPSCTACFFRPRRLPAGSEGSAAGAAVSPDAAAPLPAASVAAAAFRPAAVATARLPLPPLLLLLLLLVAPVPPSLLLPMLLLPLPLIPLPIAPAAHTLECHLAGRSGTTLEGGGRGAGRPTTLPWLRARGGRGARKGREAPRNGRKLAEGGGDAWVATVPLANGEMVEGVHRLPAVTPVLLP